MTTQTLTPNATFANSGTVVGAAGTVHASLADTVDGNYVEYEDGELSVVQFTTYTLTTGQIVAGLRVRLRGRQATSGQFLGVIGTSPFSSIPGTEFAWLPTSMSFADYTGLFVGASLTQANINDLMLTVQVSSGDAFLTRAVIDLIVAEPPTVTVNNPTGTIGSPTPTASWTYTPGSDGGPQSRYRVKVFSAAQYGAGGFDPETSTATWDSGTLTGAASSIAVTTPLANATTYRAYVKVTHTINSIDASSSWAFNTFTTSFATSDVSSVTCTPNNSTGAISVVVARNTGTQAWAMIEVERSNDGGTTWTPVRGATRQGATNTWMTAWAANSATVVDYESGNGIAALYRARAIHSNSGVEVVGPWTTSSSTSWTSTATFIKDPFDPTKNATFRLAVMPGQRSRRPQGVFDVLGRSAPIVVSDARKAPAGELAIHTPDSAAATALLRLADAAVWLLHGPASHRLPAYVVPAEVDEARAVRNASIGHRYWQVGYQIVERPADDT
jgi:hypothetical protein